MPTREDLIQQVEAKRRREDLIRQVEEKRQRETASEPESEGGALSQLAQGVAKVARSVDSYTGAPVRKGIGAIQDGKSIREAAGEAWNQVGEDPSLAPTEYQIAEKAGFSPDRKVLRTAEEQRKFDEMFNPGLAASQKRIRHVQKDVESWSPAEVAGTVIGATADVTNALPFAGMAKKVVTGAVKGFSKAANVAAKASDAAFRVGGNLGKRAVQTGFGVPEEAIERYLARHPDLKGKVGASEMMEELSGRLDTGLKPVRAELDAAEKAVEAAKARRSEDLSELLVKRQEAREALKQAEDQALGEAASRLSTRVKQLDKKVSEGSADAFKILDDEGVRVPVTPLKGDLTKGINAMRPVTDEQVAVVELLKRYRDRLDQFGKDMPGGEAKRIIQSLDREMKHIAPGEVARMSREDQVLGILRRRFDAPLKASPAYASKMEGVASDMRTLNQVRDFASESDAARAIRAAQTATGKDKANAIRLMGEDVLTNAKRSNLPEYHRLRGILHKQREVKKGASLKSAESKLETLQTNLGGARQITEQGLAGIKDRISAFVRSGDPKAVHTESILQAGKLADVNMAEELADIKTIAAFEKSFNRGSANTNVWAAIVGGLMGSVTGPVGGVLGAATGGVFGRHIVDSFGPAVGRVILDQAPLLKRMNPADWIRSLDVPNDVKLKLAKDLSAYRAVSRGAKSGVAASKAFRDVNEARKVAEGQQEQDRAPADRRNTVQEFMMRKGDK